jgi:hypothetical protein
VIIFQSARCTPWPAPSIGNVDALFSELQEADVLHDVSRAGVATTDFGTRKFATLDVDGNLLTFFRWE